MTKRAGARSAGRPSRAWLGKGSAATWVAATLVVGSAGLATFVAPSFGAPLLALAGFLFALWLWSARLSRAGVAIQGALDQLLTAGRPDAALAALDGAAGWTPRWIRRHLASVRGLALVRAGRAGEAVTVLGEALGRVPRRGRAELLGLRAYARARGGDPDGALADAERALSGSPLELARSWAALARVLAHSARGDAAATARELEEHGRFLLETHLPEERRLLRRVIDRAATEPESVYRVAPGVAEAASSADEELLAPVPSAGRIQEAPHEPKARGQAGALLAVLGAGAATVLYALARGARPVERPWPEHAPSQTVGFQLPDVDALARVFLSSLVCALMAWLLWTTRRRLALADELAELALRARRADPDARHELARIAEQEHASLAHAADLALAGVAIEAGHFDDAIAWTDRALALVGLTPRATADARALRGLGLACAGRLEEAEAEATAAGTELHVETRRYAIRLIGLLRRGELAAAARLVEAKADRLPLQERFEALGLLTRLVCDPVLARAREHAWVLAAWEGPSELRGWVERVAPPLAEAVSALGEAPAAAREATAEEAAGEREATAEEAAGEREATAEREAAEAWAPSGRAEGRRAR